MEQFVKNFDLIQPQLVSLVIVTIIILAFAIFVKIKSKKMVPTEAPRGTMILVEQYIGAFDDLFQGVTAGKLNPVGPYIFSLFTFLLVSNITGLFGFPQPTSAYSVPLLLGFVAWSGIYVVGIIYHRLSFFKRYLYNPTDILSQFAPLISISFRLFGNMIAGTILIYLVSHFVGYLWGFIPIIGNFNLLAVLITPPLRAFFDLFDGVIQAFVFALLTTMYWTLETPEDSKYVVLDPKDKSIYHDQRVTQTTI